MGQIIFLNPFPKTLITGGIKATYSHAEFLAGVGFSVIVYQPDGPPVWLPERLQALVTNQLAPTAADILVFPEALNGWIGQYAREATPARKVMFCQNQYYLFSYGITAEEYAKFGFIKFIAPGNVTKRAIESVLKLPNVSVVPSCIDPQLFFPRDKVMQIATVPRKFPPLYGGAIPGQAFLIRTMLALKYPHLRSIPWQIIEGKSEQETAEIFGRSTILLALCYMEACPLVPLEAMSSGCIVVGYTGYGGLEYATAENGFWFSPEQLEEVTDALANVIDGLNRGDQKLLSMRQNGMATAARFNKERTIETLQRVYGPLLVDHDRAPVGKPNDIATLNNQALELHRLNRLDEALAIYDRLLAASPDAIEALYNRGNVLKDLQRYDEALASYDKALTLKPDYVVALNNRGFVLHVQQRFEEALKSYNQVLAIKPDHASSLANRNLVLQELERNKHRH